MIDMVKKNRAGIWAKIEHSFRAFKRHFGFVKVR